MNKEFIQEMKWGIPILFVLGFIFNCSSAFAVSFSSADVAGLWYMNQTSSIGVGVPLNWSNGVYIDQSLNGHDFYAIGSGGAQAYLLSSGIPVSGLTYYTEALQFASTHPTSSASYGSPNYGDDSFTTDPILSASGGDFGVNIWAKNNNGSNGGDVLLTLEGEYADSPYEGIKLQLVGTGLYFSVAGSDGNNHSYNSIATIGANAWANYTINWQDGVEFRIYVNGSQVYAASTTYSRVTGYDYNSVLGGRAYNGGNTWEGDISQVVILNREFTATEIGDLAGGQEATISGGSGGSFPSLHFVYPVGGSTTPQFSNFLLSAQNITSTDEYNVAINYLLPGVTQTYSANATVSGAQLLNQGIVFPNLLTVPALGIGAPQSEIAYGFLNDVTNIQPPYSIAHYQVATTSVSYIQLPSGNGVGGIGSLTPTTTVVLVTPFNQSGTILAGLNVVLSGSNVTSTYCDGFSSSSVVSASIEYGVCQVGVTLFEPTTNYTLGIENAIESFQTVFPFSVVFDVTNGIESGINGAVSSTPTTLPLKVLGINGNYIDLGDLTSSTDINALTTNGVSTTFGGVVACNTGCASEKVNNLFMVFTMLIWVTAGLKMVHMVITIL